MSRHENFDTLYKWIRQAKEVIFLLVTLLAYIYSDEIKSFISKFGEDISVDPLKIIFLVLIVLAAVILLYRVISFWRSRKKPASEIGEKHTEGIAHPSNDQMIQKGVQFYRSREELPPLDTFLSQAKQEVFVAGTTLHAIVGSNREMIRDLVKSGKTVRLLFLDPKSKFLGALSDCLVAGSEYGKAIILSLKTACSMKRELTELERNRLDIRTYDALPFYTMLMVDPNTGDGIVRIEPYFYGKGERARSSFQISEKEQKDEFQKHLAGYKYLCEMSKEYQCH